MSRSWHGQNRQQGEAHYQAGGHEHGKHEDNERKEGKRLPVDGKRIGPDGKFEVQHKPNKSLKADVSNRHRFCKEKSKIGAGSPRRLASRWLELCTATKITKEAPCNSEDGADFGP